MGALLSGEIKLEMNGTPAEIGLDVTSKMLRAVVLAARESGMEKVQLSDLLLGMLCGVCANFAGELPPEDVQRRLRHASEILQGAPRGSAFHAPAPGTVQ